jgi:hypothetical protein
VFQPVEEQVGEQERREMVDREGAFEPVRGDVPGVPVPADIVDQHIDPGEALQHLPSQPPHLRLGRQIRDEHVHLPAAGCPDLASRGVDAAGIPASDRQVRTHHGQAQRGRPTDAGAATSHQHRPAGHRPAADLLHAYVSAFQAITKRVCVGTKFSLAPEASSAETNLSPSPASMACETSIESGSPSSPRSAAATRPACRCASSTDRSFVRSIAPEYVHPGSSRVCSLPLIDSVVVGFS